MFEGLFQPMHLLVIFGIALLVFGPKKLPELGKGIGEGIRGFKSAMGHVARAKAQLEEASRGFKSQLAAELDPTHQDEETGASQELAEDQ